MRRTAKSLTLLAGLLLAGFASADLSPAGATTLTCLSDRLAAQAILERKLVAPAQAVRAARASDADLAAETLGVHLCMDAERPVYVVTTIRVDGRVMRVKIDGASGRAIGAR